MSDQHAISHMGVMGMKWGMSRAAAKGGTYTYQSHATKKYTKKAANAKTSEDAAKFANRAKRSAQMDTIEQKVAK